MYGYGFFFEFQLLVNKGYGVIYTNPRGGAGFGQQFQAAVNARLRRQGLRRSHGMDRLCR
jgi:dipeptidyl aminopeptidase/acylaminoacyl peptidase